MIGLSDIPKFLLAFFLVLPVISVVHESGHVFFAWVMGGKNIKVTVGSGKPIFHKGMLVIRKYYFWYGVCTFDNIKKKNWFSNSLIFAGGSLFNFITAGAIMILVENGHLEPGMFTYQFTYFSLYYIFFALFPMQYPDGNYSDGKVILDLIRGKEKPLPQRTYRVQWKNDEKQWNVTDYDGKSINSYTDDKKAIEHAGSLARANRPSRVLLISEDREQEIQNYPRIPL